MIFRYLIKKLNTTMLWFMYELFLCTLYQFQMQSWTFPYIHQLNKHLHEERVLWVEITYRKSATLFFSKQSVSNCFSIGTFKWNTTRHHITMGYQTARGQSVRLKKLCCLGFLSIFYQVNFLALYANTFIFGFQALTSAGILASFWIRWCTVMIE